CQGCGGILTGRRKKWCSAACQKRESRRRHLWNTYRITLEEYEKILEEQGGVCAICGKHPKPGKSLAVDHAHRDGRSGPVRGCLCFMCNKRFLGARSDRIILAMAEYVSNPPAVRALGEERI